MTHEPPAHVVSKHMDKLLKGRDLFFKDCVNGDQEEENDESRVIRQSKPTSSGLDEILRAESLRNKYQKDKWELVERLNEPLPRLLVAAIKWLHTDGAINFNQLKETEQTLLLHNNWKELLIITAAQHQFGFEEGTLTLIYNN